MRSTPTRSDPVLARSLHLTLFVGAIAIFMALSVLFQVHTTLIIERDRLNSTTPVGQFEDYVAYYAAGRLVLESDGGKLYDLPRIAIEETEALGRPASGGVQPFFNPPFVAVFLAGLSALSLEQFGLALLVLNLALVLLTCVLLVRFAVLQTGLQRAGFALGYLSLASIAWVAQEGQLSMFILLGFLGFARFERTGNRTAAGASLALVLIKPQMLLFLVPLLLWHRRWPELRAFCGVAFALVLISIAASPSHFHDYPRFLLDSAGWSNENGVKISAMYGWNGFVANLTDLSSPPRELVLLLDTATLGLFGFGLAATRRWAPNLRLLTSAAALASLLVNPHLYFQELALLPLVIVCGLASSRHPADTRLWGAVGLTMWLASLVGRPSPFVPGPLLLTPAIAALLAITIWQLRKTNQRSATDPIDLRLTSDELSVDATVRVA